MKVNDIICEASDTTKPVGRELQHIEDIIYINGPQAALGIVNRLKQLTKDSSTLILKWDGSPSIRFGRDDTGQFHYGDKYVKSMNTSPDAVIQQIMARKYKGKGDPSIDQHRYAFAHAQAKMWKLYEGATPKDFRGFVDGDLLWETPPPIVNNEFIIEPNVVKYFIQQNSQLGKRMAISQSGVALHFYRTSFNSPREQLTTDILHKLGSKSVVAIGPKSASGKQVKIDQAALTELETTIRNNADEINTFLSPIVGLDNIAADVYTYINSYQDSATPQHFVQWAKGKFPLPKFEKICTKNANGLHMIFNIMNMFVKIKLNILTQLESQCLQDMGIRAELKHLHIAGGEGFVDTSSLPFIKLVNRATFTKANKIGQ